VRWGGVGREGGRRGMGRDFPEGGGEGPGRNKEGKGGVGGREWEREVESGRGRGRGMRSWRTRRGNSVVTALERLLRARALPSLEEWRRRPPHAFLF
jgi:hypothetical protein